MWHMAFLRSAYGPRGHDTCVLVGYNRGLPRSAGVQVWAVRIVEMWNTLDRESLYGEVVTYAVMGKVAYTWFASNHYCY